MPDSYNKPFKTYSDQVELLKSRGFEVTNDTLAASWMERVGYYRLKPYWMALVDKELVPLEGRSLASAVDLYIFDQRLRRCLTDGLQIFEITARVAISHSIGRCDPLGHRSCAHLDASKSHQHHKWLERADKQLSECRESWIDEFKVSHGGEVPTWMAVEAWSFGVVSKLYSILHRNDRAAIAKKFVVNPVTFETWLRAAATLRNSCAHYNRVWNKPLVDQPATPKGWEAKPVQHIGASRLSQTRVYALCAVLAYLLDFAGGKNEWVDRLKLVIDEFPTSTGLSIQDAGFPVDWKDENLWC